MLKSSSSKLALEGLAFILVGGLVLIIGVLIHRHNEKHKYCHRPLPSGVSLKYCENSRKFAVCVGFGPVRLETEDKYEDSIFNAPQYVGERISDYVDTRKETYFTTPPHELQFNDSCSAKNYYFEKIYIRDSLVKAEDAIIGFNNKVTDSLNIANHCYK